MTEKIRILGVDPSLRNTGLAIVSFDTEKETFSVEECQVLINPQKYTGTAAILNMLDMIREEAPSYILQVETILIESPAAMFNKSWAMGTISLLAHVSGGAVALFGLDHCHLIKPSEWNKSRKKEVTTAKTVSVLGSPDTWKFRQRVKHEKYMEHVIDAAGMALWWIKENYLE